MIDAHIDLLAQLIVEEEAGVGGGGALSAKSVIFDIADNYGDTSNLALRSVGFKSGGELVAVSSAIANFYRTTALLWAYEIENVFTTELSKTGSHFLTSWLSGAGQLTNQRLICVFNDVIAFDEIVVNNYHTNGGYTSRGCKNVKIQITPDAISSTIFDAPVSNGQIIFNSVFAEHVAANVIDDQILTLI